MGSGDITITVEQTDIEKKTTDEKLDLLLKIAFSNHSILRKHGEILFGNGKEGLCDTVRKNKEYTRYLIYAVGTAIVGFAGIMYGHLMIGP